MATIPEPRLLTAEEYGRLPDDGRLTELVRGMIVEMKWPFTSHDYTLALALAYAIAKLGVEKTDATLCTEASNSVKSSRY